MWINESALTMVSEAEPVMRGRPHVYSDALIQALLTLKQVYHLTLRAVQGFAQSLRELAFAELPVLNYTRLSRRARYPSQPVVDRCIWSWAARASSSTAYAQARNDLLMLARCVKEDAHSNTA